jgi:hypothetical protein
MWYIPRYYDSIHVDRLTINIPVFEGSTSPTWVWSITVWTQLLVWLLYQIFLFISNQNYIRFYNLICCDSVRRDEAYPKISPH